MTVIETAGIRLTAKREEKGEVRQNRRTCCHGEASKGAQGGLPGGNNIYAAIGKITGQASLEMEYSRVVESTRRVGSEEEVWEISLDCGILSLLFSISTSFKQ